MGGVRELIFIEHPSKCGAHHGACAVPVDVVCISSALRVAQAYQGFESEQAGRPAGWSVFSWGSCHCAHFSRPCVGR